MRTVGAIVIIGLACAATVWVVQGKRDPGAGSQDTDGARGRSWTLPRGPGPTAEPRYATPPRYCQLALGAAPTTRAWVVQSGTMLYVDRDLDGVIEASEAIEGGVVARDGQLQHGPVRIVVGVQSYELTCATGSGEHVLTVVDPAGREWRAHGDQDGPLEFAPRVEDAPVVHIDGPLQIGFETKAVVVRLRDGTTRVAASVGCHGRGPGSFAHLRVTSIPPEATPIGTVTFMPTDGRDRPEELSVELGDRC